MAELREAFWHQLQLRWHQTYRLAFPPDSFSNAKRRILALGRISILLAQACTREVTPAPLSQRILNTENSSHQ
jgi:hypothetical protein